MRIFSKSPRPITDVEIRQIKNECYADIESGLWGQQCKTSMTAKENCALKCLSPICYELIYESDPLEEGEKDLTRSQEYKYCMYKILLLCYRLETVNLYVICYNVMNFTVEIKSGCDEAVCSYELSLQ
ncbi:hypothetical protein OIU77_004359 [Salix suchowensis]|uniref:Uncharacterized protein n=1 Tax=Salix suchowensis TaxID=1278906 RepID=A0ABQ9AVR2_9ROSI|nr:hypothetical protein OIU77_004359 [Salix suchowensis]